jgi:hypothetical protein
MGHLTALGKEMGISIRVGLFGTLTSVMIAGRSTDSNAAPKMSERNRIPDVQMKPLIHDTPNREQDGICENRV